MPKVRKGKLFGGKVAPDKLFDANQPITVQIAGEEWRMSRITLKDIHAVYGRIRDNRISAVLRHRVAADPHMLAEAIAYTAAIDPEDADFWKYLQTPGGLTYVVWRCMAPHHPGLTEQKVADLMEGEAGLLDVLFGESGLPLGPRGAKPDTEGENSSPLPTFESNRAEAAKSTGESAQEE